MRLIGCYLNPPTRSESRRRNNLEPEIESELHFFLCEKLTILRDKCFLNIKRPDNFESLCEGGN